MTLTKAKPMAMRQCFRSFWPLAADGGRRTTEQRETNSDEGEAAIQPDPEGRRDQVLLGLVVELAEPQEGQIAPGGGVAVEDGAHDIPFKSVRASHVLRPVRLPIRPKQTDVPPGFDPAGPLPVATVATGA